MTFLPQLLLRKPILAILPKATGPDLNPLGLIFYGFRLMLEDDRFEVLVPKLNEVDRDWRGFAYEGSGHGFAFFDYLFPWGTRLQAFLRIVEDPYLIPVYLGAGMALARLRSRRPERFLMRLEGHPVFKWMGVDGYGFFKGYFSQQRYLREKEVPKYFSPYARHVFDQGLGRSIWYALGEDIERVAQTIATFPGTRQADLWAGASFSCAYAGSPMERQAFEKLRTVAGPYQSKLALAGALAAKRRHGFGHITSHTEMACQVFCGLPGEMAAHIADNALENLPTDGVESPHKIWRERIEAEFAKQMTSKVQSGIDAT